MDEFLTAVEIAELLKVNQQTVRHWIDRGELPAVRVGARRVRVRQSELDQILRAGSTGVGGKQFAVIVVEHGKHGPKHRRVVGPFPSRTTASAWCDAEGLDGDGRSPRGDRAAGPRL